MDEDASWQYITKHGATYHMHVCPIQKEGDIQFFKNMSDVLLNVINDGTNDIKEHFFEQAKMEVSKYAAAHRNDDHTTFVREVWAMLVRKYYWRFWFVASYDDELYGEDNRSI